MNPLVVFHVIAGSVALASGGAALGLAKGSKAHRFAGLVFTGTMFAMAVSGGIAALALPAAPKLNTLVAATTAYLVATGWKTVCGAPHGTSALDRILCIAAASIGATGFAFAALSFAAGKPVSALTYAIFAGVAVRGAVLDLALIRAGRLAPAQRIPRHLWRMTAALAIAAFAFFIGQQHEFPEAIRGAHWAIIPLGILGALAWWMVKLRPRGRASA